MEHCNWAALEKRWRDAERRSGRPTGALPGALRGLHVHELYALAALGRLDEVDERVDSLVQQHYLARGWSRNAADTYLCVGRELRGHGFADHARKYFERCIALIPKLRNRFECMNEAAQYEKVFAYFSAETDRRPPPPSAILEFGSISCRQESWHCSASANVPSKSSDKSLTAGACFG